MRTAIINLYENGRLRVLDCESLAQSHHLSWLKRLYGGEEAGWKCCLNHLLKKNLIEDPFFFIVIMALKAHKFLGFLKGEMNLDVFIVKLLEKLLLIQYE